jgi:hypothetical protein
VQAVRGDGLASGAATRHSGRWNVRAGKYKYDLNLEVNGTRSRQGLPRPVQSRAETMVRAWRAWNV